MLALDAQLAYFKERQVELAREHHGKFVLIHDASVEGFYESDLEAYSTAKRDYQAGSFLIRQCLNPSEETVHVFHSRVTI